MKKPIKYALIAILAIAAVAGGIYAATLPTPVRMTEIRPQTAQLTFMEQGIVTAGDVIAIFSSAHGEIVNLYAQEGDFIEAGQPLVSVDNTESQLRLEQVRYSIFSINAQIQNVRLEDELARQGLQATLNTLQGELAALNAQARQTGQAHQSQAAVTDWQAQIQQILIYQQESELAHATENLERTSLLYSLGVVPRIEYDQAHAAVDAIKPLLESAQAQLEIINAGATINDTEHFDGLRTALNAQISGITQQLNQDFTSATISHLEAMRSIEEINRTQIEREIENSTIYSPVSGVITAFHAQNTNILSPLSSRPVAEITIQDQAIEAYVSTQDIRTINVGDTVRLTFRQRLDDIEFYGTIERISNTATVRHTALGVEEWKVNVRIQPEIPEGLDLGTGFALDTTFFVFSEENRIIIPRTAVFQVGGIDYVWAVIDGQARQTPVTPGAELRTDIIIESGLTPGDWIINDANNTDLQEGVRVTNE